MTDRGFGEALNAKVANEFSASMQYVGAADYIARERLGAQGSDPLAAAGGG